MELVVAEVRDDRIVDALLDGVRRDASLATLLADHGDGRPAVVGELSALLAERLDVLGASGGVDDHERAYRDALELAHALRELRGLGAELEARLRAAVAKRRGRRTDATDAPDLDALDLDDPDLDDPDLDELSDDDLGIDELGGEIPMPVHVAPRPGRNEPCWCGNGKKYKKCHLDADEAARLGSR